MSELEHGDAHASGNGHVDESRYWKDGVARDEAAAMPELVVLDDEPMPVATQARHLSRGIDASASAVYLVVVMIGLVLGAIGVIGLLLPDDVLSSSSSSRYSAPVERDRTRAWIFASIGLASLVVLVLHLAWPKPRVDRESETVLAPRVPLALRGGAATLIAATALLLAALGASLAWRTLEPVRAGGGLDMGGMLTLLASFGPILFGAVGLVMLPSFVALWSARGDDPMSADSSGPSGSSSPAAIASTGRALPPDATPPTPHALPSAAS